MQEDLFLSFCSALFPFWKDLAEEDRADIFANSSLSSYPKGKTLHDGNECSGLFFVRSGSLRVYILSEDGKEVTLYRLHKGDMCMLSASCVLQSITFDVIIDAQEDCECYVLSGPAFARISEKYPAVKIFALETALNRFSDVMWVFQQIMFMSADKRLAIFLIDEAARLQTDTIALTHEQIAKYMGSAREVVSRLLKYFSGEGLVEVSRKGVTILDKKRLTALATQG